MVFIKGRGILADRVELFTERGEGCSVNGMCVAHRDNIGVHFVHRTMQHKARLINRVITFNHGALMIGQNQV
jgi:hypothetical protein